MTCNLSALSVGSYSHYWFTTLIDIKLKWGTLNMPFSISVLFITSMFSLIRCNIVLEALRCLPWRWEHNFEFTPHDDNFAIISTGIYFLFPYLLGHSLFNPKDIPFLSVWVICTYYIIQLIKNFKNNNNVSLKSLLTLSLFL